ncbi:DNA-directed RNA polymerase II subunit RPB1 [Pancytospora philotis]|nr:DNA-directed RNA polymerase II subunit RPB1 [Pancytospora philotis]
MLEDDECRRIAGIQFGLFSPEEIKRGSVVHVVHPETMEGGIPKEGGLIDLRMGTTERTFQCQTCNQSSYECDGHHGHIELARPMFHIGYMGRVKKVLECVCFYCSKIKVPKRLLPRDLNGAWEVLRAKSVCEGEMSDTGPTGCGNKQPVIKREGLNLAVFMKGDGSDGKVLLNGEKVYAILKKMSEEDFEFLGFDRRFCRPDWMLLTVLHVPPPSMRPSIVMNGYLRGEDDLTHKLADIVKSNAHLRKYEQDGAPGHVVRDHEQLLQFHLATFIDNDIGGQPQSQQKNGRPLKSLSARLKGKEGRVRGNLMGKRVDFSARSVITPDPNIRCDEVGVPVEIAKIHTFPERVNAFNIAALTRLVQAGPNDYPGANYVIRNDGQRIDLHFSSQDLRLETGAIVERHMQDGDFVLFNRQPSLHKMSMMGHRARVMPGKTFRLNLSVTAPYNADFDGDEMNLHMPQSYNTRAELSGLVDVAHQIVTPQSNRPVIGIVQDATVGARLFTLRNSFFRKSEAMALLFSVHSFGRRGATLLDFLKPAIVQPVELWTGKQLFSALLPEISYHRSANFEEVADFTVSEELLWKYAPGSVDRAGAIARLCNRNLNDCHVSVIGGRLVSGVVDKKFVGAQQGGCIHVIYNDCGPAAARDFIDNLQKMVNHFMLYISAFSVGIGDCVADGATLDVCRESIHNAMDEVDDIINSARRGELEKAPGMSIFETFESSVNVVLNKARDVSGTRAQNSLHFQNNMKTMVAAGSKGSYINISQVTTCVGQQNVEGKRIPFGFIERALPHFCKYDFSARARGFIENSYLTGLSPCEFFFHAMGGREGLIDTAIKTAETGYIQRRLVKALEGATVHHDYSVRTETGTILQFIYGDDAFDATHLENVSLDLADFKSRFFIDNFIETEYAIPRARVSADVHELLREDVELQKLLDKEYEYLYSNKDLLQHRFASPVNIRRLLDRHSCPQLAKNASVSPYRILAGVKQLLTGNAILDYYLRASLAVKTVLGLLTPSAFDALLADVSRRLLKAKINAFEMVGTLAAQSVGEPATQMTLNTFHLAGVASTVTMGVPRLNEIINVSQSIRTPSMKVVLVHPYCQSIAAARHAQTQIEYCSMKHVCRATQLVYDPDPRSTVIEADRHFIDPYFEMPDDDVDFDALGRFVVRLEVDRALLVAKDLSLETVASKIRELYGSISHTITSDENDTSPVIRVRFLESVETGSESDTSDAHLQFYNAIISSIMKIHIQGLENVRKAYISSNGDAWRLDTDGVNFQTLLSHPCVHGSKLVTNDFITIASVLGIEAARQSILNELSFVIEANGSYVNQRHLALLADVMTVKGFLTGITRHGVNKAGAGALRRASFEQTVDILLDAAVNAEIDNYSGITENIMMGQLAPLGTGNVQLVLDTKKLSYSQDTAVPVAMEHSAAICYSPVSSSSQMNWSPQINPGSVSSSAFSPMAFSPDVTPLYAQGSGMTPGYSPLSPGYAPLTPSYRHTNPAYSAASPMYSPATPGYGPASPSYSPTTPGYGPASPSYTPTTPGYRPSSPTYSPHSPAYSPDAFGYAPKSPGYAPTTPNYMPLSPTYSPASPAYTPRGFSSAPRSPSYTPTTPGYSPTSPGYRPASYGSSQQASSTDKKEKPDN